MSFTKFAAETARNRAAERFKFHPEDLVHFRTLHSTAYRLLGLTPEEVMRTKDYEEVAIAVGLTLSSEAYGPDIERPIQGGTLGDACMRIYGLSRARGTDLQDEWRKAEELELLWPTVRDFAGALEAFKNDRGVMDFADMLDECVTTLPVDALFIDEAQDMTPAQWALARRLSQGVPTIRIAGDDDQALYDWSGADSRTLISLMGERVILPHSYRMPQSVKALADGIAGRIKYRVPKQFTPRDEVGRVTWVSDHAEVDLRGTESWMLLARHQHQLDAYVKEARSQGVVYRIHNYWSNQHPSIRAAAFYERLRRGQRIRSADARVVARFVVDMQPPGLAKADYGWDDLRWPFEDKPDWMTGLSRLTVDEMEYIRALRKNGESLVKEGRVTISTIHGAKGGEADNVVLNTDVTARTMKGMEDNPDAEERVWYVGVSRARHNLIMVFPRTPRFWAPPDLY